MTEERGRRRIRVAGTALAFPLVVAVSSFVLDVVGSDELDAVAAAVFLIPTAVFGAVVAKAWALLLPAAWALALLIILRLVDLVAGTCSICGSDEDWGNYPFFFFAFAVVPLSAALGVGVVVGVVASASLRCEARVAGSSSRGC